MTRYVLLDSGPLGLLTVARARPETQECTRWLAGLLARETKVVLPEIADYEVRRELLRLASGNGISQLDQLQGVLLYVPITTEAMRYAARLWAEVRRRGRPTADPHALDADVILAAQALTLATQADDVVIATTNVRHLALFADARPWRAI